MIHFHSYNITGVKHIVMSGHNPDDNAFHQHKTVVLSVCDRCPKVKTETILGLWDLYDFLSPMEIAKRRVALA